jgi:hypothetical protein
MLYCMMLSIHSYKNPLYKREYVPGAIVTGNEYGNKLMVISDEVTSLQSIILVDVLLNPQQGLFTVLSPEREVHSHRRCMMYVCGDAFFYTRRQTILFYVSIQFGM